MRKYNCVFVKVRFFNYKKTKSKAIEKTCYCGNSNISLFWLILQGNFETAAQSLDMRLEKRGCCRPCYSTQKSFLLLYVLEYVPIIKSFVMFYQTFYNRGDREMIRSRRACIQSNNLKKK